MCRGGIPFADRILEIDGSKPCTIHRKTVGSVLPAPSAAGSVSRRFRQAALGYPLRHGERCKRALRKLGNNINRLTVPLNFLVTLPDPPYTLCMAGPDGANHLCLRWKSN